MSTFYLWANDKSRATILQNVLAFLWQLPDGKSWEVSIKRHIKERSSSQNKALWGHAYKILEEETGQSAADWHEYMLGECFGWIETRMFDKKRLRPARTTTTGFDGEEDRLDTEAFARYFDFIQRRAAENGVYIADPDPQWRENMAREAA